MIIVVKAFVRSPALREYFLSLECKGTCRVPIFQLHQMVFNLLVSFEPASKERTGFLFPSGVLVRLAVVTLNLQNITIIISRRRRYSALASFNYEQRVWLFALLEQKPAANVASISLNQIIGRVGTVCYGHTMELSPEKFYWAINSPKVSPAVLLFNIKLCSKILRMSYWEFSFNQLKIKSSVTSQNYEHAYCSRTELYSNTSFLFVSPYINTTVHE